MGGQKSGVAEREIGRTRTVGPASRAERGALPLGSRHLLTRSVREGPLADASGWWQLHGRVGFRVCCRRPKQGVWNCGLRVPDTLFRPSATDSYFSPLSLVAAGWGGGAIASSSLAQKPPAVTRSRSARARISL